MEERPFGCKCTNMACWWSWSEGALSKHGSCRNCKIFESLRLLYLNCYKLLLMGFGGWTGVDREKKVSISSFRLGKKLLKLENKKLRNEKGEENWSCIQIGQLDIFPGKRTLNPNWGWVLNSNRKKLSLCMPCIGSPIYVRHYNVCPCKNMVLLTHAHLITVSFFCKIDCQLFFSL